MTTLQYGSVALTNVKTKLYKEEAVYDGPNYLYTKITMTVQGYFNPKVISYKASVDKDFGRGGGEEPPVTNAPLYYPASTVVDLRHYLLTPRRRLTFTMGGANGRQVTVVRSPEVITSRPRKVELAVDAANGPFPVECVVSEVMGDKTFVVHYTITTAINDCERFRKSSAVPGSVLSNLWTAQDELDQDYFITRTITGRAVFHSGRIRLADPRHVPDSWRIALLPAVPFGFRRDNIKVKVSDDGLVYEYQVTDRQQAVNLTVRENVTRIEAFKEFNYSLPNPELAFIARTGAVLSGIASFSDAVAGRRASSVTEGGLSIYNSLFIDNRPRYTDKAVVKVWGNKDATKTVLVRTALDVLLTLVPIGPKYQIITSLQQHITGRYVQAEIVRVSGPQWDPWRIALPRETADAMIRAVGSSMPGLPGGLLPLGIALVEMIAPVVPIPGVTTASPEVVRGILFGTGPAIDGGSRVGPERIPRYFTDDGGAIGTQPNQRGTKSYGFKSELQPEVCAPSPTAPDFDPRNNPEIGH